MIADAPAAPADPASASPAIEARNLSRSFGPVRALDGFDATLPWGNVTALVGPNGAGKTTLLLILVSLLAPDRGAARVAGSDCVTEPFEVHRNVGWMPDFFGVYDDLTPREYLELFAAAYKLPPAGRADRARELLAAVRLEDMGDVPVHTLSRGQKQRLGFARTIVHRPDVLVLDEPASGLDPRARIDLRNLVRREAERGAAVLISSHILAELEEMSDIVVLMDRGKSRGMYPLNALPSRSALRTWRVRALEPGALRRALAAASLPFEEHPDGSAHVTLASDEAAADLLARLVRDGVRVSEMARRDGGLEGAFLSMSEAEER